MYDSLEAICKGTTTEEDLPILVEFVWAKLVATEVKNRALLRRYSHDGREIFKGVAKLFGVSIELITIVKKRVKVLTRFDPPEGISRYEVVVFLDTRNFSSHVQPKTIPVPSLIHLLYSIDHQTNTPLQLRTLCADHLLDKQSLSRYIFNKNDDYLAKVVQQHMVVLREQTNQEFLNHGYFILQGVDFTQDVLFRSWFEVPNERIVLDDASARRLGTRRKKWHKEFELKKLAPTPPGNPGLPTHPAT
jgi:hypothetical protein